MNEKINPTSFNNGTGARGCERATDLVAYLYGEAAPGETKSFRRHLDVCAVCRDELTAFGGLREMVGEWRTEVLSSTPSLDIVRQLPSAAIASLDHTRERSALAALREFFKLSPLWLRVGTATAVLAFCVLAALTFARAEVRWDANGLAFNTGVRERGLKEQVQVPARTGYTQEQVEAMMEERVGRELADARRQWEADNNQTGKLVQTAGASQRLSARNPDATAAAGRQQSPRRSVPVNARREQQYVAENDFYPDEERVPRLTDLLGAVKAPK
jgi:hypothetical protein